MSSKKQKDIIHAMTYCIVASVGNNNAMGGAVATGGPCVGGYVLHALANVGYIATQGFSTNTLYGYKGLRLLEKQSRAAEVCRDLTLNDIGRGFRQLIILDRFGNTQAWTGEQNKEYCGHKIQKGLAVAGNWLDSSVVLDAMEETFLGDAADDLHLRLLSALKAGFDAGGDKRGTFSAALKVVYPDRPPLDIRVDYEKAPLDKMSEIVEVIKDNDYQQFLNRIPRPDDPYRY